MLTRDSAIKEFVIDTDAAAIALQFKTWKTQVGLTSFWNIGVNILSSSEFHTTNPPNFDSNSYLFIHCRTFRNLSSSLLECTLLELVFFSSFLSITFLRTLYTSFSGRNSWNSADCPENWRPWIPHIFVVCLMVWRANKLTGLCLYNPESWYPRFRVWWGSIQPYLYNCFTRSLHSPFESRNMTCERKLNLVFTHFNTNITWIPVLFKL